MTIPMTSVFQKQPHSLLQDVQVACDPNIFEDTSKIAKCFRDLCLCDRKTLEQALLQNPDLIQKTDSKKQTLLHYLANNTIFKHSSALINVALNHNASVTARDEASQTPLHTAFHQFGQDRCIYQEILPTLLEAVQECDIMSIITTPDSSGDSLLHLAAKYQHYVYGGKNISFMEPLLSKLKAHTTSVDFSKIINESTPEGWTVLDVALCYKNKSAIQALVTAGATLPKRNVQQIDQIIEADNKKKIPPLSEAELEQIKKNLSLASTLDKRIHAFHYIVKRQTTGMDQEFIFSLLRDEIAALNDADVNYASTKDGYTFLHVACLAGDAISVQNLLTRGASVEIENKNGVQPIGLAVFGSHSAIYKLLKEKGAKWKPSVGEYGFKTPPEVEMTLTSTSAEIAQDLLNQCTIQDINKEYQVTIAYTERTTTLLKSACNMAWMLLLFQMGANIETL